MIHRHHFHRPNRALQLHAAFFMALLYVPILFIPLFSFSSGLHIRFPIEGFTLSWYQQLFGRTVVLRSLENSVRVALGVLIVSTCLGVLAARALVHYRIPGKGPILGFMLLPVVAVPIIFGVALLLMVSALQIPLSLYTIAAEHIIICLLFAIATLLPRFEGYDPATEEAAADLGENGWWVFWRVTVPIILPGIVASLLLTFTVSFDEFVMAFFPGDSDLTLPIHIWGQLRIPRAFPVVLALGTLILLFSFVLVFIGLRSGKRRAGQSVAVSVPHAAAPVEALRNPTQSPAARLWALMEAHFAPEICTPTKIAVWFAFFGEGRHRETDLRVSESFDTERSEYEAACCGRLIAEGGHSEINPEHLSQLIESTADGLWLDMLLYPGEVDRVHALGQMRTLLRAFFPWHFPPLSVSPARREGAA